MGFFALKEVGREEKENQDVGLLELDFLQVALWLCITYSSIQPPKVCSPEYLVFLRVQIFHLFDSNPHYLRHFGSAQVSQVNIYHS